jgi:succinylarginine dihydrolase
MDVVMVVEVNIDALVGPTHHFGGLGVGNLASQEHAYRVSSPRQAALEGLKKASLLASLGIPQFMLLPPVRPDVDFLRQLGFQGSLQEQLTTAFQSDSRALSAVFSGAFMWAANSATVSAAADTADGCLHMTPANLISSWHRASEASERAAELGRLFSNYQDFRMHAAVPAIVPLRDEGAANHMRLCDRQGFHACNVFTFGSDNPRESHSGFFPRQTRAACEVIARQHGLDSASTFY